MTVEEAGKVLNRHSIETFYEMLISNMNFFADAYINYRHVASRTTADNLSLIEEACNRVQYACIYNLIPIEGTFLRKTDLSVKAFKFLICNTNFSSQSLIADDATVGCLVKKFPPLSPYLFIEILWHIHFEDILTESILHLPLDLCVDILEILPRCIDLLNFKRGIKFLSTLVSNTYKKLLILRDNGGQTQDMNANARKLAANLQELILQFTNDRFLKFSDISNTEKYKKSGILLKTLLQMVRMCLASKCTKIELPSDMVHMYKLTFSQKALVKIENEVIQEIITEIDQELINLLLKKVKEIDCNIYMDWTEYDDEENTSLSLQRSVGLECYFFVENTKAFKGSNIQEYDHLVECLQHLVSKPDPKNSVESLPLKDLCHGAREGRKECLLALFQRYKEWDDDTLDGVDSSLSSLSKDDCEQLFENLAKEFKSPEEQLDIEKLQLYTLCLGKALAHLNITDLYEVTIQLILRFSENSDLEKAVDISTFEKFIMLHPNFSTAENLRVVLFFLCLKTRETLKILLKMAIGHSDYPDVAISFDDLIVLLPILKIQVQSKCGTMLEALKIKCTEKKIVEDCEFSQFWPTHWLTNIETAPETALPVQLLQEIICLEPPGWNGGKFANLLELLVTFCPIDTIVSELFVPFLQCEGCTPVYLKYILVEVQKYYASIPYKSSQGLRIALENHALRLLKSTHLSRYVVDELLTLLGDIMVHLLDRNHDQNLSQSHYSHIFLLHDHILGCKNSKLTTRDMIGLYDNAHQSLITDITKYPLQLPEDDVIRHLFLKCTKSQHLAICKSIIADPRPICGVGKLEISDNLIRLTIETCCFCLEFPEVCYPDSLGFLVRCLMHFLTTIEISVKRRNRFQRDLCLSLDKHLQLLQPIVECTALAQAYNDLVTRCREASQSFDNYLAAYEQFALASMHESERLRTFVGPRTPKGIRMYLAQELITTSFEQSITHEAYMEKLGEFFGAQDSTSAVL